MSGSRLAGLDSADLHEALDAGAIGIALQPLVNLRRRDIVRFEALARWTHPTRGSIPPAAFIPIAERSGQITALTSAVLLQTALHLARWRTLVPGAQVDVNVSMLSLHDPTFPELLASAIGSSGLEPSWFGLEITESTFMHDPERTTKAVEALRSLGCRISIDDFGSGYSSLGHLATLPVNAVKIDRQFVVAMFKDYRREAIVRATIGLGHDLGFEVVAEGVEDRDTWELLVALGCDLAQGYHIARPMAPEAVPAWIRAWPDGIDVGHRGDIEEATVIGGDRSPDAESRRPVLVVDDEPAIRELIVDILGQHGFRVTTAANGEEALRSIEAILPSVVLLDMYMPLLDGRGVVDAVRRRGLDLPIVVMTAGPSAERWAKALQVDGYLRKPFDMSSVIDVTSRFAVGTHEHP